MLGTEEAILVALNEAGNLATGEALKQFDTDGSPLVSRSAPYLAKALCQKSTRARMVKSRGMVKIKLI